jgi:hypothetical protein
MNLYGVLNLPATSLTASTTYNLACGTAPAHQKIAITGFGYYGAYNAAGTPGLLQMCTATSGGSSGTTITPAPLDQIDTTTFQSTWLSYPSGAPSAIAGYDSRYVNPQLGLTELWSENDWYIIKGGGFWVLQFTPAVTVSYAGWIRICE